MTEQPKANDFATALKAAIIDSLTERKLITPAEKKAINAK